MTAPQRRIRVLVCRGPTCGDQRDSATIRTTLERHVTEQELAPKVILDWQSCFGQCQKGPNVLFREARDKEDKLSIAMSPLIGVGKLAMHNGVTPERVVSLLDRYLVAWGFSAPAPVAADAGQAKKTSGR